MAPVTVSSERARVSMVWRSVSSSHFLPLFSTDSICCLTFSGSPALGCRANVCKERIPSPPTIGPHENGPVATTAIQASHQRPRTIDEPVAPLWLLLGLALAKPQPSLILNQASQPAAIAATERHTNTRVTWLAAASTSSQTWPTSISGTEYGAQQKLSSRLSLVKRLFVTSHFAPMPSTKPAE